VLDAQIDIDQVKVNYVCYQKELPRVLAELAMQNQVNLAYTVDDIPAKPVSINAKGYSLRETLDYLLEGTRLVYETVDYNVVIYREEVYRNTQYTVGGYVRDQATGERLLYADVYLKNHTGGATTNDYGYYHLTLPRGETTIICSYLGYQSAEIPLFVRKDQKLDIFLEREEQNILDEVLITADRYHSEGIGFFKPDKVDLKAMERMVSLGGEDDIFRLMYTQPGILTGADGFGGMHVRGGNSDQNLVLLDGTPVYNAQHAIGLYSIFNSHMIQSAKLMKGDIPARYGGGASSVLDIRTRNGDKTRHRGQFNLGLFTLKAGLEGPLVPGKVSYLLSGRRTYADIWINSLREYLNEQQGSSGATNYYNYDLHGKIHARLNTRNSVFLSFYQGRDRYVYDYTQNSSNNAQPALLRQEMMDQRAVWGNRLVSLKWTNNPSGRVFLENSVVYSAFEMDNFVLDWVGEARDEALESYRFSERLFLSGIEDLGFQSNLEIYPAAGKTIRLGIRSTFHRFDPAVLIFDSETYPDLLSVDDLPGHDSLKRLVEPYDLQAWENRIYFEHEQEIRKNTRLNIGLQLAHFILADEYRYYLEPRFILNTRVSKKTVFRLSATSMTQFLHLLTNNGLGFPAQVWLPSTSILQPQRSWQLSLGINTRHSETVQSFVEAYYKGMDNLVMVDAGEYLDISLGMDWDSKLPVGIGFSYGVETGMSWQTRLMDVSFNYGLLYSKRKFEELNAGVAFDHRFSRRHNLNASLNYRLNKNISLSVNWTYGTGNPYTFPTQIASFVENGTVTTKFIYEALNNRTIPDYHRLDLEFNFSNHFSWGSQRFTLGAYNAYNRKNPFYITYDNRSANINEISNTNFKYVYVFPLVPVLNYSIDF
jgi:hypothetical protein